MYPVISRRSRGLSIGVNLNPDTACNFDCVYCQVDRSTPPRVREVDVDRLGDELSSTIEDAQSGVLFEDPGFSDVPVELRRINDIAFSGDGEPTTCKHFVACVELTAALKRQADLRETKIVLITDACYLTRDDVVAGLAVMDENDGEIWAKLDAGTDGYFRTVNRPNYSLNHVLANITAAARARPIVIQSLFMRLHAEGPDDTELRAYTDRLIDIKQAGGRISRVQVYTIARQPAESFVTPLNPREVAAIAKLARERAGVDTETFC